MRFRIPRSAASLLLLVLTAATLAALSPTVPPIPKVNFRGADYFYRYSKADLHEFTPPGQENLQKWQDMITLNNYPQARDGEALAQVANGVLGAYKGADAKVIRTSSSPAKPDRPAEHLIVVLFARPDFIEAAFTRFLLKDGVGLGITVSHRKYGPKVGNEMSDWLKANGPAVEKELLALETVPKMATAK